MVKVYAHNVVQVVILRRTPTPEFLVLKRTETDGGWWQPVTGHIDEGESELDALRREVAEETGLRDLRVLGEPIYSYEYETSDGLGKDVVYAVEVSPKTNIVLNPEEHDRFEWLPLEAAVARLKYDGNKESLRRASAIIG